MKTWMKIAVWSVLTGGISFFAGLQIGQKLGREEGYSSGYENAVLDMEPDEERISDIQKEYLGETANEETKEEEPEQDVDIPEDMSVLQDGKDEEEEETDIPQLHPQHLIPERITEEEYNRDLEDPPMDKETLIYYDGDQVLYNTTSQSPIGKEEWDELFGVGVIPNAFVDKNHEIKSKIFVRNETWGTKWRIYYDEDAFCDAVDGSFPPEDDMPEEDED